MEALVRWRHPELGVLRPDSFIGLAEETGLIVRLGDWVLAEACREARRWLTLSPHAPFVSVNLAVRQVHGAGLVDEVRALLDRTGLPPHRLQLEITESAVMSTAGEPVQALRVLAELGVRIAIDDFGTGYSNLAYLRSLPVCELKVAGSFVAGLQAAGDDPASHTDERILATLVSLAHALNLTVTAEGVETAGQAERLRAIGCDAAQGWHFGRPEPAGRIHDRLGHDRLGHQGQPVRRAGRVPARHYGFVGRNSSAIRSACSSQRHSRSTQARPAAPIRRARTGSSSRVAIRSASCARSRPSTR